MWCVENSSEQFAGVGTRPVCNKTDNNKVMLMIMKVDVITNIVHNLL